MRACKYFVGVVAATFVVAIMLCPDPEQEKGTFFNTRGRAQPSAPSPADHEASQAPMAAEDGCGVGSELADKPFGLDETLCLPNWAHAYARWYVSSRNTAARGRCVDFDMFPTLTLKIPEPRTPEEFGSAAERVFETVAIGAAADRIVLIEKTERTNASFGGVFGGVFSPDWVPQDCKDSMLSNEHTHVVLVADSTYESTANGILMGIGKEFEDVLAKTSCEDMRAAKGLILRAAVNAERASTSPVLRMWLGISKNEPGGAEMSSFEETAAAYGGSTECA